MGGVDNWVEIVDCWACMVVLGWAVASLELQGGYQVVLLTVSTKVTKIAVYLVCAVASALGSVPYQAEQQSSVVEVLACPQASRADLAA